MSRTDKWFYGSCLAYLIVGIAVLYVSPNYVLHLQFGWLLWIVIPPISKLWGIKPIWKK